MIHFLELRFIQPPTGANVSKSAVVAHVLIFSFLSLLKVMETLIELTVHLPILKHPLVVSISPSSSFKTIVDGLCQQQKLPPYYTIPLLSALTSAFNQTYLTTPNNNHTSTKDVAAETQARQRFINAYQENTLLYYNKHEEVRKECTVWIREGERQLLMNDDALYS
jgi:hypothetical protein